MRFTVLGSGSTGNAILITAGETRVLVDAGLSAKETVRRLALVGEDASKLDGIIITHEHGDHAGGLRVLLKASGVRSISLARRAKPISASATASPVTSRASVPTRYATARKRSSQAETFGSAR
jgi:phosphoribosyl 1,2-cyclic phosphodiesterase